MRASCYKDSACAGRQCLCRGPQGNETPTPPKHDTGHNIVKASFSKAPVNPVLMLRSLIQSQLLLHLALNTILCSAIHRRPIHPRLWYLWHLRHVRHRTLPSLLGFDIAIAVTATGVLLSFGLCPSQTEDEADTQCGYKGIFDNAAVVNGRAVCLESFVGCTEGTRDSAHGFRAAKSGADLSAVRRSKRKRRRRRRRRRRQRHQRERLVSF